MINKLMKFFLIVVATMQLSFANNASSGNASAASVKSFSLQHSKSDASKSSNSKKTSSKNSNSKKNNSSSNASSAQQMPVITNEAEYSAWMMSREGASQASSIKSTQSITPKNLHSQSSGSVKSQVK